MTACRKLTIFEGPDGGGKSTFAKMYAKQTDAHYVHFGPLLNMDGHLARLYVEAMQPALFGHADVVFDRSWLSELPYGVAYRDGRDRIGPIFQRMLERLAMRCATVVVRCLPPWETAKANFLARKGDEYLANVAQLRNVYDIYKHDLITALPMIDYDYTDSIRYVTMRDDMEKTRTIPHTCEIRSAGHAAARYVIVSEACEARTLFDPYYQWPCASFSQRGPGYEITKRLHYAGIDERVLLWVNANQSTFHTIIPKTCHVFAFGQEASARLILNGIAHTSYAQASSEQLVDDLQKALKGSR